MAVICSAASLTIIQTTVPIKKPVNKVVMMVSQSPIPAKKTPPLQIRSSSRTKIFEDQSKGIVCYRDESGETTCEGYDEGPRPTITYHPSDAEIIDLLQKNWFQIVKGGELKKVDAGQEDFNR
ncbi:Chromodomain-helicase-DNA-binding protein like [Actinidia chinensis var. chinensis]|uniref:Chromodomain-helicase-DNA-binding protein like n=1 Tax=Actinidia chinensis var. chinensis TaxID=1590841 RepID=A0A2R6R0I1_ACTCC|nr:Chromodomain-helicase-DNA-binding protein like [Actinidia chinensis var. chinensis]